MRTITDKKEIKELLSKYEFWMVNFQNHHEGEMTTLNEKDIDDIIGDLNPPYPYNLFGFGIKIEVDDNGMVIVTYPTGVCRLESRGLREDKHV